MYKHFFKRLFDFCIALVALIVLSPVLLVISVCLFIANSKGSPLLEGGVWGRLFFTQERPGKDEKIFKVIKFKSMTDERDANGVLLPDKERITNIGKFVRKTSIDELPQLVNVLKGDMALIGPRPLLPEYLPYYTERERLRHTVRPGISGWAQVNGRNNLKWEDRLECDAYYAEHLNLWFDIKIIMITIKNVLEHKDIVITMDPKKNVPLNIYRQNHGNTKTF
jgi:lipopolysaccharide/colanic/teichoic acid biosynthesis glycosyltransferase